MTGVQTCALPISYTGVEHVAVPAAEIDVTVIQAVRADEQGNIELPYPLDFIYDFDHLIGRAAKKLFRTQPALTGCIRRLEETLGTALFERVGRGERWQP